MLYLKEYVSTNGSSAHLDDNVGGEISGSVLHDVAVDGIVGQVDAELGAVGYVLHTAVGPGPGVHLSVEHGRGGDLGNHLGGLAFDGDLWGE